MYVAFESRLFVPGNNLLPWMAEKKKNVYLDMYIIMIIHDLFVVVLLIIL